MLLSLIIKHPRHIFRYSKVQRFSLLPRILRKRYIWLSSPKLGFPPLLFSFLRFSNNVYSDFLSLYLYCRIQEFLIFLSSAYHILQNAQGHFQETSICSRTTARDFCLLKHKCKRLLFSQEKLQKTSMI